MKKQKYCLNTNWFRIWPKRLKREFQTDAFVREFAVGYGIADLVFAKSFYSKKNKLNRKPISNYYSLMLLSDIAEKYAVLGYRCSSDT